MTALRLDAGVFCSLLSYKSLVKSPPSFRDQLDHLRNATVYIEHEGSVVLVQYDPSSLLTPDMLPDTWVSG